MAAQYSVLSSEFKVEVNLNLPEPGALKLAAFSQYVSTGVRA